MRTSYSTPLLLLLLVAFGSCGSYKNYSCPTDIVSDNLFGDVHTTPDSSSMALMPWQQLFTDERLQQLIAQGLTHNTDLRIAQLRIEQTEAALTSARLAFLPSLNFAPQGAAAQFGNSAVNYTYTLPVSASWQIDLFGKLRNAKERAKMRVEESHAYRQVVQSNLIATIASHYYTLAMLREQATLVDNSAQLWQETLRAMRLLMEVGQYTDAAVAQAEANYTGVQASAIEIAQQIKETENALSVILGDPVHTIDTHTIYQWQAPNLVEVGIPLQLLAMRPDVKQAETALAAAFYTTAEARADFYPSLTLGGNIGWSNLAMVISNPGKLVWDALASLSQPLFANGRLKAQYRIAKAQQEEAKLNFQQTLLNAGAEVNSSYSQVQTFKQQAELYQKQIEALQRAVRATQLLMEGGSSNYLEILTAQDALLAAQLAFVVNQYNEINAYISLYQALGGGLN